MKHFVERLGAIIFVLQCGTSTAGAQVFSQEQILVPLVTGDHHFQPQLTLPPGTESVHFSLVFWNATSSDGEAYCYNPLPGQSSQFPATLEFYLRAQDGTLIGRQKFYDTGDGGSADFWLYPPSWGINPTFAINQLPEIVISVGPILLLDCEWIEPTSVTFTRFELAVSPQVVPTATESWGRVKALY